MKLTAEQMAKIKARNEADKTLNEKVGMRAAMSEQDRTDLLDHIESRGFWDAFAESSGALLGWAAAWVIVLIFFRWAFHDDIIQAATWLTTHIRIAP